mmetsp:Transcript_20542/g.27068  ORF Transcript_20542/g.27068 Transcript_20542/m.27068 type:complete len:194 (-) Transcript_20542:899-1480(-)
MAQNTSSLSLTDIPPRTLKILSLYSLDTDVDDVISKSYSKYSQFHDPIVSVYGIENVKGQFRSLKGILRSSRTIYHSSYSNRSNNSISIESTLCFKPKLWYFGELRIRMFIVCELDDFGKIVRHTDHWSLASLFQILPIISTLYNTSRYILGTATSNVVNIVWKLGGKLVGENEKGSTNATHGQREKTNLISK